MDKILRDELGPAMVISQLLFAKPPFVHQQFHSLFLLDHDLQRVEKGLLQWHKYCMMYDLIKDYIDIDTCIYIYIYIAIKMSPNNSVDKIILRMCPG